MLTMMHMEPARSGLFSDLVSQASNEDNLYDHFSCPLHPGFKLQVLCPKENFHPSLLCIKCMIDPEIERQIKNESLIAIYDVINKGTSANPSNSYNQMNRNLLKDKIVEFSSKDYLGCYERHTDTQMKKLQREIDRVKLSLDELQKQFQELFDKQYKYLKSREEELKKKINEYVEDQEQLESLIYSNPESIMDAIRRTNNIRDYEKMIKALYHRGSHSQKTTDNSMLNGIFDTMEELREKINKMKSCKIQTSVLEDIRHKIDSIELLDQSIQTTSTNLNPKLIQTLEKIRMAEEKKKTPQKDTSHQLTEKQLIEKLSRKRADFLGPLKEKLANFGKKDTNQRNSDKQMELETNSIFDSFNKTQKIKDRETYRSPYGNQSRGKTEEREPAQASTLKKGKDSATQTFHMNTSRDEDYYRMVDEDRAHRRQKVETDSYRRVDERKARETERAQDEHRQNYDNGNFSAEYPAREEYVTDNSAEPQPKLGSNNSKTNSAAKSKQKDDEFYHKSSKKNHGDNQNDHTQPQRDSSLDNWIQQDQKERQRDKERDHDKEKNRARKEASKKQKSKNRADNDANDARGSETDNSNPTTPRRARVKGLHDWINRRVTGYLIFQNTIHDEGLEKENEGDHLNRVAGEKWKGLTKAERDEYKNIAMKARIQLKREFQDVEKEDPHIKELQEILEKKIKKVKKD